MYFVNYPNNMILTTDRLVLRPWLETDAADLYNYAKDERIGSAAGWPPHQSVEESAEIIRTVFSLEGVFAVALKEDDRAIGLIGLVRGANSNFPISEEEAEISYWIGVPFWGKGYIPEAIREVNRYGFEEMGLTTIWSGYFEENDKSKRAQEKCGYRHHHIEKEKYFPFINETRTEHISRLTREEWEEISKVEPTTQAI